MKLKKLLAVAVAMTTMATISLTTFAATGINAKEQEILDKLQTEVTTKAGAKLSLPDDYLAQAKTYLSQPDIDITADQAEETLAQINDAIQVVKVSEAKTLKDLSMDDKQAIIASAQSVAEVYDLKLSYNADSKIVTLKDQDGTVIFKSGNVIKTTGADAGIVVALGSTFAVVLAAGALIVLKKKSSENA